MAKNINIRNILLKTSQEMHFQLFGKYIEDYQEGNAQIILCYLQKYFEILSDESPAIFEYIDMTEEERDVYANSKNIVC